MALVASTSARITWIASENLDVSLGKNIVAFIRKQKVRFSSNVLSISAEERNDRQSVSGDRGEIPLPLPIPLSLTYSGIYQIISMVKYALS